MTHASSGMVYLVGAGPGDPGLITVRGLEVLRRADVVIYDRLLSPGLLDEAPPQAERIYVGKASGDHTIPQEEINRLLIEKAWEGKKVVRLKGGDPFVFGRGGEEALALAQAGVPFEVIPGVTSAVAVPAYAGIPVTHRGMASSFVVYSGHPATSGDREIGEEAGGTAGSPYVSPHRAIEGQTRIYLMGMKRLPEIVASLLAEGYSPETPAALVRWGTTPRQETVIGRLGDLPERAKGLAPPAVLVVGQVVSLRERLRWFENRPLFGKRILVTRAQEQAKELSRRLVEAGAEALEFPVIQVLPVEDTTALDAALCRRHDWVIFTSANGIRAVWQRLCALGRDARAFAGARLCAIGPATATALAAHGLHADLVPSQHLSQAILEALGAGVAGQRILLLRADKADPALADGLREKGAIVEDVVAYRTIPAAPQDQSVREVRAFLEEGRIDAFTFMSSSAVRGFIKALGEEAVHRYIALREGEGRVAAPVVACIGPVTAQAARQYGLPVHVVAQEHTLDGLVAALVAWYCSI